MKKIMSALLFTATLFGASLAFAGGVHCKECPSESSACMPLPDCPEYLGQLEAIEPGKCPSNDTLDYQGQSINSVWESEGQNEAL
jgi:hypothetical protein